MSGGKSNRVRVRAEVIESQRLRLVNDVTEDPESPRGVPDLAHDAVIDALGDELGQQDLAIRGLGRQHAERAVPRSGLIARHLDDSFEHGGQLQVGRDREDRVENPLHLAHDAKRSLARVIRQRRSR